MAKFCTRCGRPLAEGEVCNCNGQVTPMMQTDTGREQTGGTQEQTNQNSVNQAQAVQPQGQPYPNQAQAVQPQGQPYQYQQAVQQPSKAGLYLNWLFKNYFVLLRQPVTEGRKFIDSGDYPHGIGYILLQAIFVALYGVIFESKIGSYVQEVSDYFSVSIKLPYASAFFGTLAWSCVLSFALAGILLASNLIFKNVVNFRQMINAAAMRCIVLIPVIIVSIIITLLNPLYGMVLFYASNIWGVIAITKAMPVRNEKASNLLTLSMFITFALFLVISVIVMTKSVGLYLPKDLLSDLKNSIMNNLF